MQQRALNAYLETPSTLLAVHRDGEGVLRGKRIAAEFVSYHRREDVERAGDLHRDLRASAYVRSLRVEGDWIRIAWHDDGVRRAYCTEETSPLARAGVRSYEADVTPARRWITDNGIEVAAPRRCYLDLETDSRVPFSRKEEMRVLCWSVVDGDDRRVQSGVLLRDHDEDERELLHGLWTALRPYDQVLAWNGGDTNRKGDGFDFPVLFARTRARGIGVDARRWLWLDHLALFRRMNMHSAESGDEKQSMKLEDIGQSVTGRGKLKTPEWVRERFGEKSLAALSWDLWEAGGRFRDLLVDYNAQDTELLADIEKETGYAALFATLCEACRVFGDTAGLNPTRQMDGFLLRLGMERGHHFPTREYRDLTEKFAGAYVMQPRTRGIAKDVHVADFASLYPSIILTFNMSPDTRANANVNGPIPDGVARAPTTGVSFRVDHDGILPTALREMIRLRKAWNDKKASLPPGTPEWHEADRRSTAYKVAANSFYGVVGSAFSRYYDRSVAESVTQTGVWLIKQTNAEAEKRGMSVVYTDTDSLYVQGATRDGFDSFVKWCNAELYPELLKKQGCRENTIKLAYEKEFARIVFASAKRYAGSYRHYKGKEATANSKPEVKGLEYKRGDAAKLARTLQACVIDLLVGGLGLTKDGPVPTDDLERYHALLSKVRDYVLHKDRLPLDEVKLSKALSKPLREYAPKVSTHGKESESAHITVAKILLERGQEVAEKTRIEFVVIDGSVSPMKVIPADDYAGEVDRHYIWERLVYPPTQRLLANAFPDHDWDAWAHTRPPKPRGRNKPLPGQLGFDLGEPVVITPKFVVDGHARVRPALKTG